MKAYAFGDKSKPVILLFPGTVIHVFYAKKMGEKYRKRYEKYFAHPDIIEFDLRHEELLLDADRWVAEVCKACDIQ